jgi:hypothetical protein
MTKQIPKLHGLSRKADEAIRVYVTANPDTKKRKSRAKVTPVWQPRIKSPGEAQPNRIDMRHGDYTPALHNPGQPVRPGAMDFARYESKGLRT